MDNLPQICKHVSEKVLHRLHQRRSSGHDNRTDHRNLPPAQASRTLPKTRHIRQFCFILVERVSVASCVGGAGSLPQCCLQTNIPHHSETNSRRTFLLIIYPDIYQGQRHLTGPRCSRRSCLNSQKLIPVITSVSHLLQHLPHMPISPPRV